MKKSSILRLLKSELQLLNEVFSEMNNPDDIHPVELELSLSKAKTVYELLQMFAEKPLLKADVSDAHQTMQEPTPAVTNIEPTVTEPVDKTPIIESVPEPEIKETVSIQTDKSEELVVEQPLDEETKSEPEIVIEQQEEKEIIASTEKEEVKEEDSETPTVIPEVQKESEATKEAETPSVEPESEMVNVEPETKEEISDPEIQEAAPEILEGEKVEIIPQQEIEKPKEESPVVSETPSSDPAKESGIIADKFQNNAPSINEMMASFKKDRDLASKLKDRPIYDLKTAVKLNDRIWFINELFQKDAEAYKNAVEFINQCKNLDDALAYIFKEFAWDQNKPVVTSFLELVYRRFTHL